jgi:uncharacterized protein
MPILNTENYKPSFLFRNAHINTIFPPLLRQIQAPAYVRERIITPDDDFLDLDWLKNGNHRLAVLCHGLEGSTQSQYIKGTSQLLHADGWDVVAKNFRTCSGEMNRQLRMYHSGATDDLHHLIKEVEIAYDEIVIIGFSLGGNVVLKYTNDGLFPLSPKIKKVVAVSVPVDLYGSAREMLKPKNKLYENRFLKSLYQKALLKHQQYPDQLPIEDLKKIVSLFDFDDYCTAPIHGFDSADDYYRRCSSLQFLENISLPTLIINAKDDSFLSEACYPIDLAEASDLLHLAMPNYGGHVGFTVFGSKYYWQETEIARFVNE